MRRLFARGTGAAKEKAGRMNANLQFVLREKSSSFLFLLIFLSAAILTKEKEKEERERNGTVGPETAWRPAGF